MGGFTAAKPGAGRHQRSVGGAEIFGQAGSLSLQEGLDAQQKSGRGRLTRRARRALSYPDSVQEIAQLLAAAGVAELAQGLRLDLADALARDVELLADLLERAG